MAQATPRSEEQWSLDCEAGGVHLGNVFAVTGGLVEGKPT